MKLVYEGMFEEVEVPEANVVVRRGQPVEVADDVAERLLKAGTAIAEDGTETPPERPDWRRAAAPARRKE